MTQCIRPGCNRSVPDGFSARSSGAYCSDACRVAYHRMRQRVLREWALDDLVRLGLAVVWAHKQNNYLALIAALSKFSDELAKFVQTGLPEPAHPSSIQTERGGDTSTTAPVSEIGL